MEIFFGTKEENNKRREDEFLNLSHSERLLSFLEMISFPSIIDPSKNNIHPNHKKGNFILSKKNANKF